MILLFSGGYDSSLLLLRYIDEVDVLLHYRYDHPAAYQEFEASKKIYEKIKAIKPSIIFHVIDLPIDADNMKIGSGKEGSRYVPSRNAIFLSFAANYAKIKNYTKIIYGAAPADQEDYFDCRPVFIDAIASLLQVCVEAPLLSGEKIQPSDCVPQSMIKDVLSLSWSCYEAIDGDPCGKCNSCMQDRSVLYLA